jgi:uncharacterized protein (DUF2147 family)
MLRKVRIAIVMACITVVFFSAAAFAKGTFNTPEGTWVQIDDKTQQPHSIIKVYSYDGKIYGKILEAFPQNGKPPRKVCDLCQGKQHNAPIIGLAIMSGFVQTKPNVWDNGVILDPSSGKIYSCKLTLTNDGLQMGVRGYIGVSLLGRTQTWFRKQEKK